MPSNPHEFAFDASAFVGGVMGFTSQQCGAYILLLCYQWMNGVVPDDDQKLCEIGRCTKEELVAVRRKFKKVEAGLQNTKMESVRKRHLPPEIIRKPIQALLGVATATDAICEEIYSAYPLKVGKPDAIRAIRKALAKIGFRELLELTKHYAQIRNGDMSYVPHPSTWFNQERYLDDPDTWKPRVDTNAASTPLSARIKAAEKLLENFGAINFPDPNHYQNGRDNPKYQEDLKKAHKKKAEKIELTNRLADLRKQIILGDYPLATRNIE